MNNLNCKRCSRNKNLTQIEGNIICKNCICEEKSEALTKKPIDKVLEAKKSRWSRIRDWIVHHRNDIFSIANLILLVASLIVAIIALKK